MTGQELKQIRKSLGYKVGAFASHLGLSPVSIYQMEQGRRKIMPRTELQIRQLCEQSLGKHDGKDQIEM